MILQNLNEEVIVLAKTKQLYEENGVELSKATISVGDEVTLLYSGLLAQNGADSIYAHIGYGDNWEGKDFIPMEKDNDVFRVTIKVNLSDKLNIAFKDSVDNWDNNSLQNYSFDVSKKASKSASDSGEKKTTSRVKATAVKADSSKESADEDKPKATKAKATAKATASKTTETKTSVAKKTTTKSATGKKTVK